MSQNDPTNVFAAFEMLLEEIEVEIDFINQAGSKAEAGLLWLGECPRTVKLEEETEDELVGEAL